MSKTLGRFLSPVSQYVGNYLNTYRWLGLPSQVIHAPSLPSKLIHPSCGYLFTPPMGHCRPKELDKKLFYSVEGRVWRIPDGMVTKRASHYDSQAHLIWELSEQFNCNNPQQHPDFQFKLRRCFEKMPYIPMEVVSLIIDGPKNIYHWLFDALPRLHLVEKFGVLPKVIYTDATRPFVKQSLEKIGLKDSYILDAAQLPSIQAQTLITPSYVLYGGKSFKPVIPMWALQWIRSKLGVHKTLPGGRKVFISRQDASYRFLKEEDAIFSQLQKRGFERHTLSTMSLDEQIELFASSSYVIAPHGAGLANMVFCEPGTCILELFHPGFVQDCYWQIASALGLRYYCLTGIEEGIDLSKRYPFADIEIKSESLDVALKEMGL